MDNYTLKKFAYKIRFFSFQRRAKKEIRRFQHIKDPFFVICIPGSLHLVDVFLRYFPKNENLILILNGLTKEENLWAKQNFSDRSYVILPKLVHHGVVLDLLLRALKQPFGILDYDLFIKDHTYFDQLKNVQPDTLGNSLFITRNQTLGFQLPQTFAMFFNTPLVRQLIHKYHVSCEAINYSKLSRKIRLQLSKIGIDATHLPEETKKNFDSTRVLTALGLSEGYGFMCNDPDLKNSIIEKGIFHVNGVSDPYNISNRWRMRGSYFWQTGLNRCTDNDLKTLYEDRYPDLPSIETLRSKLISDGYTGDWYFDSVEYILNH